MQVFMVTMFMQYEFTRVEHVCADLDTALAKAREVADSQLYWGDNKYTDLPLPEGGLLEHLQKHQVLDLYEQGDTTVYIDLRPVEGS